MCETELPPWGKLWQPFRLLHCNNNLFISLTIHCYHFDNVSCILNPIIMRRIKIGHTFVFLGAFLLLAAVLDAILNTGVIPGLPRWQTLDLKTTDQDEQFDT